MSYMLDLDEHRETRLLQELVNRMVARADGYCDYCRHQYNKPWKTLRTITLYGASLQIAVPVESCKMYDRHHGVIGDDVPELQAQLLDLLQRVKYTQ